MPEALLGSLTTRIGELAEPDRLSNHRVDALAAEIAHRRGQPVPNPLRRAALNTALLEMSATAVLERVRATVDGPVVLLKGLEVAAHYPDGLPRALTDVDLLVTDARRQHRRLLTLEEFRTGEDHPRYEDHHHLAPLWLGGLSVPLELHHALGGEAWMRLPTTAELVERVAPSATGIPGVTTLDPVDHAVFVAVHAWRSAPLGRLGHLLDVEVLRRAAHAVHDDADRRLDDTAADWRVARLWRWTVAAIDDRLLGRRRCGPVPRWLSTDRRSDASSTAEGPDLRRRLQAALVRPLRSYGPGDRSPPGSRR